MSSCNSPSLSPSSSLSSPSLRSTPFSVLPPELTQLIIENTVPPTFQTSTYKSRQSTLRALCLVSKSFHYFARPLLLATFWIKRSSSINSWKKAHAKGDDKRLCRELIYEKVTKDFTSDVDLAGYIGLRSLVIGEAKGTIDLSALGQIPQLSVLRLSYLKLSVPAAFSLPKLYEFSLFQIVSFTNHVHILDPSIFPSLRLFAYYHHERLLPGIFDALSLLVPQLHTVSLNCRLIKALTPELLQKLNPITVFDTDIEDLEDLEEQIKILYLRIDDTFNHVEDYEEVGQLLSGARLKLPLTIIFPLSTAPPVTEDNADEDERWQLLQVCIGRGIQVVHENSPDQWHLNSGFSEYFMEKMRKERRKRQEKV